MGGLEREDGREGREEGGREGETADWMETKKVRESGNDKDVVRETSRRKSEMGT